MRQQAAFNHQHEIYCHIKHGCMNYHEYHEINYQLSWPVLYHVQHVQDQGSEHQRLHQAQLHICHYINLK